MPPLKVHCRLSRCAQSSRCPVIITREYVILSLLFRNRTDWLKTKTTRNRIGHVGKESPDKLFVRRKKEGILALSCLKARQSNPEILKSHFAASNLGTLPGCSTGHLSVSDCPGGSRPSASAFFSSSPRSAKSPNNPILFLPRLRALVPRYSVPHWMLNEPGRFPRSRNVWRKNPIEGHALARPGSGKEQGHRTLADIYFEPADPAGHKVVNERCAPIPPRIPYTMGATIIAPSPIPNPSAFAPAPASDPGKLPSDPATMEKKATRAPTTRPIIPYVTKPTLNAEPGPMRLSVAILPPSGRTFRDMPAEPTTPQSPILHLIMTGLAPS